jgi:saccharopine dehydrogenase (NADP+, L-glutamate forming)
MYYLFCFAFLIRSGVLLALRNNAKIFEDGKVKEIAGPELMKSAKPIFTGYPAFAFVGYPNRDSTPYRQLYNIPEAQTVIRGTLRYAGFPTFVQALVDLGYLNDEKRDDLQSGSGSVLKTWYEVTCRLVGVPESTDSEALLQQVARLIICIT